MADLPLARWNGKFRRVIHATCAPHRGPVGFTNLVVSTRGGVVVLDPHAAGACKITIDEDGARVLRDALVVWFG
ncbi:MAG: hypothetical protein ACRDRI_15280 [Pseudonocardiaceae bacterium]